jgi:hypothetical protein
MTHAVAVKLKPQHVLPDLFDWLDAHHLEFGADWTFDKKLHSDITDFVFEFKESGAAVSFALRWA